MRTVLHEEHPWLLGEEKRLSGEKGKGNSSLYDAAMIYNSFYCLEKLCAWRCKDAHGLHPNAHMHVTNCSRWFEQMDRTVALDNLNLDSCHQQNLRR